MRLSPSNTGFLFAAGALAYLGADAIHEALGHGGACLLQGIPIQSLGSAFFRSSPGTPWTDAGGPLANLVAALVLGLLAKRAPRGSAAAFFLSLLGGFNLFWASGQMIYSAVTARDDWGFALSALGLSGPWRLLLGAVGILLYAWGYRILRRLGGGTAWLLPYAAAGLVACAAALAYAPDRLGAVREAALESFGANLGLVRLALRPSGDDLELPPDVPARLWTLAAGLAFIAFTATMGRGLRF